MKDSNEYTDTSGGMETTMSDIKGLDAHLTAGPPEQPDPAHWHVSRHSDDEDVLITEDFWNALDYAAGELRELAEFEYEGIAPMGETGDYEGAYTAFKRSNELDALYQRAIHPVQQHRRADPDDDEPSRYDPARWRAPLYRGYGGDDRLMETARRAVEKVNSESPVSIWECSDELIYVDDNDNPTDDANYGRPFHAADY